MNDRVKVIDGSFSLELSRGLLRTHRRLAGLTWKVVSTENVLPTEVDVPKEYTPNDTIICDSLGGRVVFIRHHFLEVIGAEYITCPRCKLRTRIDKEVKEDVQSKQRVVGEEECG